MKRVTVKLEERMAEARKPAAAPIAANLKGLGYGR